MNKPHYRSDRIMGRSGPSLTGIAVYISTVVGGTAVIVLLSQSTYRLVGCGRHCRRHLNRALGRRIRVADACT